MKNVAVDIDGVVANSDHRGYFLKSVPPDWDGFYSLAGEDKPIENGVLLVRALSTKFRVVWVTGRPETIRDVTMKWLREHCLTYTFTDSLLMRKNGDTRASAESKVELYLQVPNLAFVVEDNLGVIAELLKRDIPACAFLSKEGISSIKDLDGLIAKFGHNVSAK